MNLSQSPCSATIAIALMLSAGCQSIDIPPLSSDSSHDRPGLGFEPSDKPPVDAYDVIVYDRIDRNWRAILDALSFPSMDYSAGKVTITFRLNQDGTITNLKILERTVSYRQTAACWDAVKKVKNLPAWPPRVRRLVGRDFRDLAFVFYFGAHQQRLVRDAFFSVADPYDREILTQIRGKWFASLDTTQLVLKEGEVAVGFVLHRDGSITNARVVNSSVEDGVVEICRQAVLDSGPFPAWPKEMQGSPDLDFREFKITFRFEK